MDFYKRALTLREETISHRRWLHSNAEVGLHMPKGQTYVMEQLRGYGLDPHPCGHGVIAELGQEGGRTILLRADMDALPMPEESGESFFLPNRHGGSYMRPRFPRGHAADSGKDIKRK